MVLEKSDMHRLLRLVTKLQPEFDVAFGNWNFLAHIAQEHLFGEYPELENMWATLLTHFAFKMNSSIPLVNTPIDTD